MVGWLHAPTLLSAVVGDDDAPRRIAVHGTSGSGKTTLARQLGSMVGLAVVELDALNHQAGWTPLDPAEFRRRVADLAAGEAWIIDGNYSVVRDLVWDRCDLAIVLDLPRRITTWRVLRRSLARGIRREELWNTNRESLVNLLSIDPERNVVLWSWRSHPRNRAELATGAVSAGVPRVEVVRSAADASRLLAELGQTL